MKRIMFILLGGLVILTAGYFSRDDQPARNDVAATGEEDSSLLGSHIKAAEKAKGVEGNIMSAFQQRDAMMDAQGQ